MKNIKGANARYKIGKDGFVYSNGRKLKHYVRKSGYCMVSLSNNGERDNRYVHRIVANAYIPNPDNKPEINHKNLDKSDNRVENLEWVTRGENMSHAFKNGSFDLYNNGIFSRKLRPRQVKEIRQLLVDGFSQRHIAKIYDVSKGTIGRIYRGETWQ